MLKGVLACLTLLAVFSLPARASQTEVGAGIFVVNGTHTEQSGARATASLVPAPLLHVIHRAGRFEFQFDAIPPEQALIGGNALGLRSTTLSYLDGTVRFRIAPSTHVGVGEMIYNQESLYKYQWGTLPVSGIYVTGVDTTDRSRIAGLEFSAKQLLRATKNAAFHFAVAYCPSLRGALGTSSRYFWNDGTQTGGRWFATSEFGSQIDAMVDNGVRIHKRTTLHYGVRYVNMSMHFSDGYLADRNVFLVPFIGLSTMLR